MTWRRLSPLCRRSSSPSRRATSRSTGSAASTLELTVPDLAFKEFDDGNKFTDCTDGELWSYIGKPLSFANHAYSHPGQSEEIWLLDVDGTRLMIGTLTSPGSSEGDIAELRSILD